MPTVLVARKVRDNIRDLFKALLEEDYFSDIDNADEYCNKIKAFIENLPAQKHRLTIDKAWGTYYSAYMANKNTTWFILFDKEDEVYLVRNIFNNHTSDYPRFISG